MKSNSSDKIRLIAEDNGFPGTLNKLAEECAEYTAARLQYHERKTDNWKEELMDVWILMQQVEILLSGEPILEAQLMELAGRKIARQIRRIKEREGKIPDL
ncbi:MAG TPA: hypothetical protein IAB31_01220 [Candidatus Choladousia intestinavium]|uniref:NTP pyrophosphohydrolase MazG putative catalytic core domain-containing protein n=1 Tax=Candidatus Choladousia intestinavium TaxID=2840727 RepID=A0A9D1D7T6_9FIRM|nr:hypothetical protein [Candidatus Choladousia intestinavium]